jgi:hypothetical protein
MGRIGETGQFRDGRELEISLHQHAGDLAEFNVRDEPSRGRAGYIPEVVRESGATHFPFSG